MQVNDPARIEMVTSPGSAEREDAPRQSGSRRVTVLLLAWARARS